MSQPFIDSMSLKFGDLKAGDCFILNGYSYEKISGNFADRFSQGVRVATDEISCEAVVQVTHLW